MLGRKRSAAVLVCLAALLGTLVTVPASASAAASARPCDLANSNLGQERFPVRSSGATNCTLRNGDNWHVARGWGYSIEGSGVYAMQMSHCHCHGQNIAVDGYFGPGTEQALKNVQSALRITRDGIFGPQTSSRMAWPVVSFSIPGGYAFPCTASRPVGPGPLSNAD